jgi:hypothetical protein
MKSYILFILIYLCTSSYILGHVGINYPSGNEEFYPGEVITIKWYIAIDHGDCDWDLYFSSDNGTTWSDISLDISKSQLEYDWTVPDISTGFGKIRVVQDNILGGDYSAQTSAFTIIQSSTDVTSENTHIKEISIYPAYPNPFNSSTIISFNLPGKDYVTLNIYNVSGQKIGTLVNGELPAGLHQVRWNADDAATGVYFYAILTNETEQTRKLILIK